MNKAGKILSIVPQYCIPGGEVAINCSAFSPSENFGHGVLFDGISGHAIAISSERILATAPACEGVSAEVVLESDGDLSNSLKLGIGEKIADGLHIVANPAIDPADGSIILTRSGGRGQELPVTLFRLEPDGLLDEMPIDFLNPTGIAFAASGQLFVTNRAEGKVCRIGRDASVIAFGSNLGIATGIAFDKNSFLYVGDRTGTIWRGKNIGDFEVFATLEPSVAAYHMAFGPDGKLYVTAPQLSSFDNVWRIDEFGEAEVFYRGLGRPQGLAFDTEGNLYVAACYLGKRGIVRISPDREIELFLSGNNIIGLCFSKKGEMIVATNDSVYRLPLGIHGPLLDQAS